MGQPMTGVMKSAPEILYHDFNTTELEKTLNPEREVKKKLCIR